MSDETSVEERIFLEAVREGSPEKRAQFVADECAGDPSLQARVESLLRAHDKAGGFLETNALDEHLPGHRHAELKPGDVVAGRYRLEQVIGEGGMATVFAADQFEPLRRPVALKVIKSGLDTKQIAARFEAERQALALMSHRNIAAIYDGGATASGRPFFVMERVDGPPITRFCDEHRLPVERRIELFLEVCEAVWHAHQKGVIHRDIKPSNVLIADPDMSPTPKVIDFGIAKATDQSRGDLIMQTGHGLLLGTPEYMSPEQAGAARDLDTRTDVFSLGVLLHELLTGTTQFDRTKLQEMAYDRMLSAVREQEPTRPSTRIRSLNDGGIQAARHRRTTATRLHKTLRGDLDWIVIKAMENDRARRYGGVNMLIDDLRRHQQGKTVSAGPPTVAYRVRKLVRRHKPVIVSAGLIVLALLIGLGIAVQKAADERQARVRAEHLQAQTEEALVRSESLRNMLSRMVTLAEPRPGRSPDYTVVEMLTDFGTDIDSLAADQPEVAADLHATVAKALRELGFRPEAGHHFGRTVELLRSQDHTPPTDLANAILDHVDVAPTLRETRNEHLLELIREALALAQPDENQPTQTGARAMAAMGWVYHAGLQDQDALDWFHRSLDTAERIGDLHRQTRMHSALATAYHTSNRPKHSLMHADRALQIARDVYDEDSPEVQYALYMFAASHARSGDALRGCEMLVDIIAERESVGAPVSVWALLTLERGVLRLQRDGDTDAAALMHERTEQWFDHTPPEMLNADWGLVVRTMAAYEFMVGNNAAARARLTRAVELFSRSGRLMPLAIADYVYLHTGQSEDAGNAEDASALYDVLAAACQSEELPGYAAVIAQLHPPTSDDDPPAPFDPSLFNGLNATGIDQVKSVAKELMVPRFREAPRAQAERRVQAFGMRLAPALSNRFPDDPTALVLTALAHFRVGQADEALTVMRRADPLLSKAPRDIALIADAYRVLILTEVGRPSEARFAYERVHTWLDQPQVAIPELASRAIEQYTQPFVPGDGLPY